MSCNLCFLLLANSWGCGCEFIRHHWQPAVFAHPPSAVQLCGRLDIRWGLLFRFHHHQHHWFWRLCGGWVEHTNKHQCVGRIPAVTSVKWNCIFTNFNIIYKNVFNNMFFSISHILCAVWGRYTFKLWSLKINVYCNYNFSYYFLTRLFNSCREWPRQGVHLSVS